MMRRICRWVAVVVGTLALCIVLASFLSDWNLLRPALARYLSAKTGRSASIEGNLRVHLWSSNPRIQVSALKLGNPPWAERSLMFSAKQITVSVSWSRLLQGRWVLPQVDLLEPQINLERDVEGRASWEFSNAAGVPGSHRSSFKLPTVGHLRIREGRIHIIDRIRRLTFSGSLTVAERLSSAGLLNGKPLTLELNGASWLDMEPKKPYIFSAKLAGSAINLAAQISIPKPFDMQEFGAKFVVSGDDLADAYYLTGLALPNTAKYAVTAALQRSGNSLSIDNLKGRIGSSDIAGKIQLQIDAKRPKLSATFLSQTLNIKDLAPALGRPASAHGSAKLLPDADLQVNRIRGMDAEVTYRAASVKTRKMPLRELTVHVILNNGILTLDPLAFVLDRGKFAGRVQIDARKDNPESHIDMTLDDVDVAQFKSAAATQAPVHGILSGRVKLHGYGTSVHKFAGAADGTVSLVIPHGQIDDALAELTEINLLRGLGLLLAKDQHQTDIRCGIANFSATKGTLTAQTLWVDTTQVLITGHGNIDLDSEHLDLSLQGEPKKLRLLRLRAPISVHGTLAAPAIGISPGKLLAQAGIGAVLGTLLTPIGAALAFVAPGKAKDQQCAAIIAQAGASPR